jgi:hypothetical protein
MKTQTGVNVKTQTHMHKQTHQQTYGRFRAGLLNIEHAISFEEQVDFFAERKWGFTNRTPLAITQNLSLGCALRLCCTNILRFGHLEPCI